jgi:sugar O-acyltransferase (sialic acid O-acetyltransferase NeuD family)
MSDQTPLVILGAGGFAGVVWEILSQRPDLKIIGCTDKALGLSERSLGEEASLPILGDDDVLPKLLEDHPGLHAILALGPELIDVRARLVRMLALEHIPAITAIHPRASVAKQAKLGDGSVVCAGAVLSPFTHAGEHCVINLGASVDHDAMLGSNVIVGQGAQIASYVELADDVVIEMGASVRSRVRVGVGARVAGGAFVNTNVPERAVVVGVPARVVRYQD